MMKKLTILMLLLSSTNVFAEWTKVGETEESDDGFNVYVDLKSIRKNDTEVKMWVLQNYKMIRNYHIDKDYKFLSIIAHQKFYCKDEKNEVLDEFLYSGNMSTGDIVYSRTNIKLEPVSIIPGTIAENLFTVACGKK
jgi:hypothetical protein